MHNPRLRSFTDDHVILPDGSARSMTFQPQVSLLLVIYQERTLTDTFFGSRTF